jgi:hypothetical protein
MQQERWAFNTAGAIATVDGAVGTVAVRGLVCNIALGQLKCRIAIWARVQGLVGVVLRLGWPVLLTANGRGELMACLQGAAARDGASGLPIALLVPPEREQWAKKHCAQVAEYGLLRAAFTDETEARRWLMRPHGARSSVAIPIAARLSTSRRPAARAGRRTPPPAGMPGSLVA